MKVSAYVVQRQYSIGLWTKDYALEKSFTGRYKRSVISYKLYEHYRFILFWMLFFVIKDQIS